MSRSFWSKTETLPGRPALPGDLKADTAVIGAGLAGVLTAYFLQAAGLRTVVLEASRIGSGQTKNTTAKITSQHGLIYHRLLEQLGKEKARQYAESNQRAIGEYRRMVREAGIDCGFAEAPAYLYSTSGREALVREWKAPKRLELTRASVQKPSCLFRSKRRCVLRDRRGFTHSHFSRRLQSRWRFTSRPQCGRWKENG